MKRILAAFALSLALAISLVPGLAFAADSGSLSAGNAELTTQTVVTVPSSGLVATSPVYLDTGQKAKFTSVAGKTYMGSVSSNWSWNASYYGIFTVTKGGKKIASKKVGLSVGDADEYIWYESSYSYKPKAVGTYKVRFQLMDGTSVMERYEKTFKVKKVTALKSYKPSFKADFAMASTTAYPKLIGLNGKTQIYRATKKGGKYKLVATTAKATYTDKKAKAGNEYWYKTRVIGKSGKKTYKSKLSAAKSEPLLYASPDVPTITSAKATDGGVALKWKKTPGILAYTVYRSFNKDSGYKAIQTIQQGDDGSFWPEDAIVNSIYTDSSAKAGRTYYYKVSAFNTYKWYTKPANSAPVKVTT